jgi:large subunit ribosomal protein L6
VDVKIEDGNFVTVKGPKGTLQRRLNQDMILTRAGDELTVSRPTEIKAHKSLHGLTRTLLNNMVVGVTQGYEKTLEVNGVGYRVAMQGKKLVMNLGYSHQVEMEPAEGIAIEAPTPNVIKISGIDKQAVGQFAANVREKRPPEPYKGKGIKYNYEVIKRKEGKTGGKK